MKSPLDEYSSERERVVSRFSGLVNRHLSHRTIKPKPNPKPSPPPVGNNPQNRPTHPLKRVIRWIIDITNKVRK